MDERLAILEGADRNLFPSNYAINALRDSRYHNTAYAVAELIDNSIEADAEEIQLLCMEEPQQLKSRTVPRITGVAVLDNGCGMSMETLFEALKFGGGTRHNTVRGIGKYGMGLPTSSMSQCKRVDVWTWQNGIDSVWHSNIDADIISAGNHEVPFPDRDTPIPDSWRTAGDETIYNSQAGTLVAWSKLDKIQWKTADAIIDNSMREIGRIHRHYIEAGIHKICGISFLRTQPGRAQRREEFLANDPLYLITPSTTPAPWNDESMFDIWYEKDYPHTVGGQEVTISVKYSIVKQEALETDRLTQNPGYRDRGRHARHNIGVSVVREDREIVLEDAFLREGGSDDRPQNRWWGCEVSFSRRCDEMFGVDHNKQMVANFTQAAKTFARDDRPNQRILDELRLDNELIYEIVGDIRDQTRAMMEKIRQMYARRRDTEKPLGGKKPAEKAARTATDADREAIVAGRETPSATDRARETESPDVREAGLKQHYVQTGWTPDDAGKLARMLVEEGLSYQFNSMQLDGSLMFNVRRPHGVLQINLNTDHPIYEFLRHVEDEIIEEVDEESPAFKALVAIRLLLSSWARMEDQTESPEERKQIQNIGINWGRQVDKTISRYREESD